MKDRSLSILLMVIFAGCGVVALVLSWLQPMSGAERGLSVLLGSVGLLVALVRGLSLRNSPVEVRVEERN